MTDAKVDHGGFYNGGGWGPTIIAPPPLLSFLVVSVLMVRKRESLGAAPRRLAKEASVS